MQVSAVQGNATGNRLTVASTWVADKIEDLLSLPYDHNDLLDSDGDGTGQDGNNDGIDDDGGNFGLDDQNQIPPQAADHWRVSPDGAYTILWNVAEDQLTANLKTIRVFVQYNDRGTPKTVVMDYVKARM